MDEHDHLDIEIPLSGFKDIADMADDIVAKIRAGATKAEIAKILADSGLTDEQRKDAIMLAQAGSIISLEDLNKAKAEAADLLSKTDPEIEATIKAMSMQEKLSLYLALAYCDSSKNSRVDELKLAVVSSLPDKYNFYGNDGKIIQNLPDRLYDELTHDPGFKDFYDQFAAKKSDPAYMKDLTVMVATTVASVLGLSSVPTVSISSTAKYGDSQMAHKDGTIYIDPNYLRTGMKNSTFSSVVSLISHEMIHAYQADQVNTVIGGYPTTVPINVENTDLNDPQTLNAMIYAINKASYVNSGALYYVQPVESQAYKIQNKLRNDLNKWSLGQQ
ncbi:MAG: hypothetical protein IPP74_07920 [Alphaproteobacteria bacterium]|nr:hypothetical protein [Alphaproteobacteria bacterium]